MVAKLAGFSDDENEIRTAGGACERKIGVGGGSAETQICGGWVGGWGVLIRWRRTNSAILHLDRSSGRHEMSVDSFPPFTRLVPFLSSSSSSIFFSFCEQRQMAGVIQSDQTLETPGSGGVEKVTQNGRLRGDRRAERNVSMNRCAGSLLGEPA